MSDEPGVVVGGQEALWDRDDAVDHSGMKPTLGRPTFLALDVAYVRHAGEAPTRVDDCTEVVGDVLAVIGLDRHEIQLDDHRVYPFRGGDYLVRVWRWPLRRLGGPFETVVPSEILCFMIVQPSHVLK
jgi:hypothetical protein